MHGSVRSRGRPAGGAGRVRLTRRGRAVFIGFGVLLAMLLAAVLAPAAPAASPVQRGEPAESEAPPVAVVLPGDTLWSVTARHVPSRDPYGMIEEVRRLNGLRGNTIHPGQQLRLPSR